MGLNVFALFYSLSCFGKVEQKFRATPSCSAIKNTEKKNHNNGGEKGGNKGFLACKTTQSLHRFAGVGG